MNRCSTIHGSGRRRETVAAPVRGAAASRFGGHDRGECVTGERGGATPRHGVRSDRYAHFTRG